MELSDFVDLGHRAPALRFLVIGGYAVGAHGHTRSTFDVDFLVRQSDRETWISRLAVAGLCLFGETRAFAQFTQRQGGDGLDLMFVDESTFDGFWNAAELQDFGGVQVGVPSLDHLLALKLHALKQGLAHRTSKDAEDVEMLVRRNHLNIKDPHYKELFLKYGTKKSTKPSSESCGLHDGAVSRGPELNLPDDPEFVSLPPLVSLREMREKNRRFRLLFPAGLRTAEERWQAKTTEEFRFKE